MEINLKNIKHSKNLRSIQFSYLKGFAPMPPAPLVWKCGCEVAKWRGVSENCGCQVAKWRCVSEKRLPRVLQPEAPRRLRRSKSRFPEASGRLNNRSLEDSLEAQNSLARGSGGRQKPPGVPGAARGSQSHHKHPKPSLNTPSPALARKSLDLGFYIST